MTVFEQVHADSYKAIYNPQFVREVHAKRRDRARISTRKDAIRSRLGKKEVPRVRIASQPRTAAVGEASVQKQIRTLHPIPGFYGTCLFGETRSDRIVSAVATYHGLSVTELKSEGRRRHVVEARNDAFRALKDNLGWSLPKIGRKFNRDHTTVLHSLRKTEGRTRKS